MGAAKNRESDSAPFEKHPPVKRMGLNCIARRQHRRLQFPLSRPFRSYRYTQAFLPLSLAIAGRDAGVS